jgi:hypothetical protein
MRQGMPVNAGGECSSMWSCFVAQLLLKVSCSHSPVDGAHSFEQRYTL